VEGADEREGSAKLSGIRQLLKEVYQGFQQDHGSTDTTHSEGYTMGVR
jgi:hypothetical protein